VAVFSEEYKEVIIGLVAPIGVDLDFVINSFNSLISEFNFESEVIQISSMEKLLLEGQLTIANRAELDSKNVELGKLREINESRDIYASLFVEYLKKYRNKSKNKIYILDSLKRPEEVQLLKSVYGKSYFTVGVTSPYQSRINQKQIELGDKALAKFQVDSDYDKNHQKDNDYTNQTNKAFQLSDLFLNLIEQNSNQTQKSIERFLDLIFGAPLVTPTPKEHNMFLAYMSSLRSADLSRQVGSAITNIHHDVIAMGANDVPEYGGGHYWPDEPYIVYDERNKRENELTPKFQDKRDYVLGGDKNAEEKGKIINEIVSSLESELKGVNRETLIKILDSSQLADITEYGRAVHAEMSAIMSAARNGIALKGATMFCTTYPCHNCAKHIVAAGLEAVVYIEPYEKSKAIDLHNDSITDSDYSESHDIDKVRFEAFSGIGPKRYQDLFSMKLGDGIPTTRKIGTESIPFSRSKVKTLRVPINIQITELNENQHINTRKEIINTNKSEGYTPDNSINDKVSCYSTIRFWNDVGEYGSIVNESKHENHFLFKQTNMLHKEDENKIKNGAKVKFELVKGTKDGIVFADKIEFIGD